jgi:hypothetical protein
LFRFLELAVSFRAAETRHPKYANAAGREGCSIALEAFAAERFRRLDVNSVACALDFDK